MTFVTRRTFFGSLGAASATLAISGRAGYAAGPSLSAPSGTPAALAGDESHWGRIANAYDVTDRIVNLEGGYFLPMALPVVAEFHRQIDHVNRENSFYARGAYKTDLEAALRRTAEALGAGFEEVAFTRGATEAMQCLIGGYNQLRRNDAVMYADLDYPGMQYAMNWLADRRQVRVKRIDIPEPATPTNVADAYVRALDSNRDVRLLLLTHISNKTGLVLPVAAIVAEARRREVDVIVDAAHAWGQIDFDLKSLGADFVGFNLHKWIGAPVGAGLLYIRKERLASIDRMMADEDSPPESVQSRVHSGTAHFATFLTVPAALDFHLAIGSGYKAARLKYLRDLWVNEARASDSIDILAPDEMSAAITSFRLRGRTGAAETERVVTELRDVHGILTVRRTGVAGGDCIRVTPALYNTSEDVSKFANALKRL
jgi:selenocysteine lyase/cysteine desulfurase